MLIRCPTCLRVKAAPCSQPGCGFRYAGDTPYLDFALPHYESRDSAHDAAHIRRIIGRLDDLSHGVRPAPRPRLLSFLACFHGLAGRIRSDGRFRAETEAFLGSLGWTRPQIEEGFVALDRHCTDPVSVEEQVVHDANYVELLGAFGVAKAFTRGGADRQSYEETVEIYEGNLRRVRFRTPRGRGLAEEGLRYGHAFIERLRQEL